MKKILIGAIFLAFLTMLVQNTALAQQATPGTGDRQLDDQLRKINEEAKNDPDAFVRRLSQRHNIPEREIREARERHRLSDADTYMATVLASKAKRRVGDVAAEHKENQGKGWGVTAQRLGIKPGSPEFNSLKNDAEGHVTHMRNVAKNNQRQREREIERERERIEAKKIKDDTEAKGQGKSQGQAKGKGKK